MNLRPLLLMAVLCHLFSYSLTAQEKSQQSEGVIDTLSNLFAEGKYPTVIAKGKQVASRCLNDTRCPKTEAALAFTWTANAMIRLSQLDSCFYYAQQAQSLLNVDSLSHHWALANLYTTLGRYYGRMAKNDKAIEIFKAKLELQFEPNSNRYHRNLSACYANLGILYHHGGDFEQALKYMLEDIKLRTMLYGENSFELSSAYHNIGLLYQSLKQYDKTADYLKKSLRLTIDKYGNTHPNLVNTYSYIAINYRRMKDYKNALKYMDKSQWVLEKSSGDRHPNYAKINIDKARIYTALKQYDEAVKSIEKSLSIRQKNLPPQHPLIGKDYIRLSEVYQLKKEFPKANECLKKAGKILKFEELKDNKFKAVDNPSPIIQYFNKSITYHQYLYHNQDKTAHRDTIVQLLDQALILFNHIENRTQLKKDQFLKIEQVFPIFEAAIKYRFDADDQKNLEEAFIVAEKSKSRVLSQSFRVIEAAQFYNVPDSLLKKEATIQKNIAELELKYFKKKLTAPNTNDSLMIKLESSLFELTLEKETFEEKVKTLYPDYYRLKHSDEGYDIATIRSKLTPNESLLEYFIGDSIIYVFLISKEGFEAKAIEKDFPLEESVKQLRESASAYWSIGGQSDSLYQVYADIFAEKSFLLYQKLIAPVQSSLKERLIIIPDGVLNFLPFEALLTERPEQSTAFKTHDYLLKKHLISYNYSAHLHIELLNKEMTTANKDLLAFAPSFTTLPESYTDHRAMRNGLYKLYHNASEAKTITSIIPGELVLEQEAGKRNFLQMAKDYKILHLATHGKANEQEGFYSFLAFTNPEDAEETDNFLYASELYNFSINADMVVLSACETGIGELKRGEGMISLARGFTYAGAQSVLNSLWNINDAQTSKLFTLFYQNIKEGMTKDEALRQAKLSYIEQEGPGDPYFWSPFILTGNRAPIRLGSTSFLGRKWGIASLGFVLLIGYFFYRRKLTPA